MKFHLSKDTQAPASDEELMGKIIAHGSKLAFETLYDRYHKKLIWFCMRFIGSQAQAEDIVQDAFIKLIDKPELFNKAMKFSTWMYTIVHHASLSHIRNNNNRARLLKENYHPIKVAHINSTYDANFIQKKLNDIYKTLSEKEQLIFVLRFEMEMSMREIASIAEIPEGSVKSCLFYLLKKLASQLHTKEH